MKPAGQYPDSSKGKDSSARADSRWPFSAPTQRPRTLDPWTTVPAFCDGLKLCEEPFAPTQASSGVGMVTSHSWQLRIVAEPRRPGRLPSMSGTGPGCVKTSFAGHPVGAG